MYRGNNQCNYYNPEGNQAGVLVRCVDCYKKERQQEECPLACVKVAQTEKNDQQGIESNLCVGRDIVCMNDKCRKECKDNGRSNREIRLKLASDKKGRKRNPRPKES